MYVCVRTIIIRHIIEIVYPNNNILKVSSRLTKYDDFFFFFNNVKSKCTSQ